MDVQQRHMLEDTGTELQALAWRAEIEREHLRQLAGTEYLPNLHTLTLDGSSVSSLRDLGSGFQLLSVLRLQRCCLCELDGAAALPALTELHAAFNAVWDLAPLQDLAQLRVLDLSSNCVEDADMLLYLQDCSALHSLSLAGNPVALQHGYTDKVKQLLPQLRHLDQLVGSQPALPSNQHFMPAHTPSFTESHSAGPSHRPSSSGSAGSRPTTASSSTPTRPASAGSLLLHQGLGPNLRPGSSSGAAGTAGSKPAVGLYWRKLRVDSIGHAADAAASDTTALHSSEAQEAADEPAESSSQLTHGADIALSGNVVRGLRKRRQGSMTPKGPGGMSAEPTQADIMCVEPADAAEDESAMLLDQVQQWSLGQTGHQQQQKQQQQQQQQRHERQWSAGSASTSHDMPMVLPRPPPLGEPPAGSWRDLQSRCSVSSSSGGSSSRPWSSSSRPLSGSSTRPTSGAGASGQQRQYQVSQQQQQQHPEQRELHKTISEGSSAAAATWKLHAASAAGPRVRSATAASAAASQETLPQLPVLQRRTSLSGRAAANSASLQQQQAPVERHHKHRQQHYQQQQGQQGSRTNCRQQCVTITSAGGDHELQRANPTPVTRRSDDGD